MSFRWLTTAGSWITRVTRGFRRSSRGKLLVDSDVLSINYSVETVNGTVYLLGIAQDEAELARVTEHARSIEDVKRVVSHVVLKDDRHRPVTP